MKIIATIVQPYTKDEWEKVLQYLKSIDCTVEQHCKNFSKSLTESMYIAEDVTVVTEAVEDE